MSFFLLTFDFRFVFDWSDFSFWHSTVCSVLSVCVWSTVLQSLYFSNWRTVKKTNFTKDNVYPSVVKYTCVWYSANEVALRADRTDFRICDIFKRPRLCTKNRHSNRKYYPGICVFVTPPEQFFWFLHGKIRTWGTNQTTVCTVLYGSDIPLAHAPIAVYNRKYR